MISLTLTKFGFSGGGGGGGGKFGDDRSVRKLNMKLIIKTKLLFLRRRKR